MRTCAWLMSQRSSAISRGASRFAAPSRSSRATQAAHLARFLAQRADQLHRLGGFGFNHQGIVASQPPTVKAVGSISRGDYVDQLFRRGLGRALVPQLGELTAFIQQRIRHGYRRQRTTPLPGRTAKGCH
jgi:hypothetical protein